MNAKSQIEEQTTKATQVRIAICTNFSYDVSETYKIQKITNFPYNFQGVKLTMDVVSTLPELDYSEFNTCLASEDSLKKEWLLPEEDEAWKDL